MSTTSTRPTCCACGQKLDGAYFQRPQGAFCGPCMETGAKPLPMRRESLICEACEWLNLTSSRLPAGIVHTPTQPEPTLEQLQAWTFDGDCEATDGCVVEPDGTCEHGHKSWLRVLGMI